MQILCLGVEWKVKFVNTKELRIGTITHWDFEDSVIYSRVDGINPSSFVGEI